MAPASDSRPAALAAHRRRSLESLGRALTPEMIRGTVALMAEMITPGLFSETRVHRDLPYGPHERHVLDLYAADDEGGGAPRPVVVYVHGGGFVAGAKSSETTPFFGNVGGWAARAGYVCAAINYRLAPESTWPGGAEDIGRAVSWLVENVSDHGGDPEQIYLVGQSAGAMHVADYVTRPELAGPYGQAVAGAALISCIYDVGRTLDKPMHRAYWGDDRGTWGEKATLDGLVDTSVPLFLAVAEFDDPQFQDHAAQLVATWHARRGEYPPMHLLDGHNHLSTVYGIGSAHDSLGPLLEQFIAAQR